MKEGLRLLVLLGIFLLRKISSFTPISSNTQHTPDAHTFLPISGSSVKQPQRTTLSLLQMNRRARDDDDGQDEDEFEFARVRRWRGRGMFADDYDDDRERDSDSTRGSTSTTRDKSASGTRREYDDDYDEIDFENDDDDEYDEEDEDEYYDDDDDDEDDDDYDEIIPNALLDQIDPDGAIDRLPELFSDAKFWKDSAIWFLLGFLYLLNRFNNPMLNGVVDLDKVDFSQFYNQPPPPM